VAATCWTPWASENEPPLIPNTSSEKVAETVVVTATPVARSAGVVLTTEGGVLTPMSIPGPSGVSIPASAPPGQVVGGEPFRWHRLSAGLHV